jgi:hypothetical protein
VAAGPAEVSTELVANLMAFSGSTSVTNHYWYQSFSAAAVTYCLSVYIKRPPSQICRYIGLKFSDGLVYNKYAIIDTQDWVSTFNDVGVTNIIITDVGGGWYRCSCAWTFAGSHGGANIGLDLYTTPTPTNFAATLGDGLYLTGVQLHRGTTPDPYFPTFGDPSPGN